MAAQPSNSTGHERELRCIISIIPPKIEFRRRESPQFPLELHNGDGGGDRDDNEDDEEDQDRDGDDDKDGDEDPTVCLSLETHISSV